MLTDIFLAARNIARQRRRSAFALAAIAFGVAALIVANGFIDWIMFKHRETTITSQFGHIQVTRKGYFKEGTADPFGYLLPMNAPELDAIARLPGVRVLGQRLAFSGLVSIGDETVSFVAEAVEPDKEQLLSSSLRIPEGANLSVDDPNGIILGLGLAANLGVDVGDKVVLIANTAKGGVNAVECRVRGFFATMSKAYDDVALRVPLPIARKLLESGGRPRLGIVAGRHRADPADVDHAAGAFREPGSGIHRMDRARRLPRQGGVPLQQAGGRHALHHRRDHRAEHFQHDDDDRDGAHRPRSAPRWRSD